MPRRRVRWLDRPGYVVSVILGVLGVIVTAAGVALFPWPSPPPSGQQLAINALSPRQIAEVDLTIAPTGESSYAFTVTLWSVGAEEADSETDSASAYVVLPQGWEPRRQDGNTNALDGGGWAVDSGAMPLVHDGDGLRSEYTFIAEDGNYGYATNGVDVVVVLPRIGGSFDEETEKPFVRVTLPISDANTLRWDAMEPASVSTTAATWESKLVENELGSASAVSVAAIGRQQFISFAAGALVAIGTGALLMIVPEVAHERSRSREIRQLTSRRIRYWRVSA